MASNIAPPTIQINPLAVHNHPFIPHRIVSSAAHINPNSPECLTQDSGDIISYIQNKGDTKTAVVERMDGTRIASFDLPVSTGDCFKDDEVGPILCYASFRRHDGQHSSNTAADGEHKMLCVLSNPTTLHIFDVLGDFNQSKQQGGSIGPSGHIIPLPFRARALFSLDYFGSDTCHGLLILRAPSDKEPVPTEVPFSPEGLSIPGTPRRYGGNVDNDLQLPPEPVRLNFQTDVFIEMEEDEVVPSLFSLCHPLDEIRPIAKIEADDTARSDLFTNVDERLLFVGSPRLFARHESHSADSAQTHTAPICVTYHETFKRHAIWTLTKAVEPVPPLPLWKTTGRGAWRTQVESEIGNATEEGSSKEGNEDMSHDNSSTYQEKEGFPTSFAEIYPDFTLSLLHEEKVGASPDGIHARKKVLRHAFLATDVFGTGDLTLCIVMPNHDDLNDQPSILRRFSLTVDSQKHGNPVHIGSVSTLPDISCISAQQIQSIPIPLASFSNAKEGTRPSSRFHSEDVNCRATDVLLLHKSSEDGANTTKLSILRSGHIHIGDLTLPQDMTTRNMQLTQVANTVGDRADIIFVDEDLETTTVRASTSLCVDASPITEIALRAVESSLTPLNPVEADDTSLSSAVLSLMMRSDCIALSQFIQMERSSPQTEDPHWYALTFVLLNILMGSDGSSNNSEAQETDSSPKSAWEELLQSDFHAVFSQGEGKLLFGESTLKSLTPPRAKISPHYSRYISILSSTKVALKRSPRDFTSDIFDSLHCLHEDSRLLSQSRGTRWTRQIGSMLLHVCEQNSPFMVDFEDHYRRLLGDSRCQSYACDLISYTNTYEPTRLSSIELSPCIMTCLDSMIHLGSEDFASEDAHYEMSGYGDMRSFGLNGTCSTSWTILRLFEALFNDTNADSRVVAVMIEEGLELRQLHDELPFGVSYPLIEAIHRCRLNPPQISTFSQSMSACLDHGVRTFYELIGRNDLAALSVKANYLPVRGHFKPEAKTNVEDPDKDGLVSIEDFSSMVFPEDNRVHEAAKLLRSSRTVFLRVPRPVEQSDHDFEKTKHEKLLLLCRRTIALPLGRGMLTLGTLNLESSEQLFIPNIVLAGRVPPTNSTLALDMTSCPPNFRVWPEFHNGVAAGLRLPCASGKEPGKKIITRTWIKFNKPTSSQPQESRNNTPNPPSYAHGGFLMALGLRGYLSALTTTDLTDYLTQGNITTTVGIFLGMSANKRGTCDPSTSKMLCLHIPSLLPPSFTPMDIASSVQAAAVAGIGLLYQGSAHRLMTEFLLNEISQPMKEQNDKEGFALVCGLALGMVNLQKGTSTLSGLEDLRIEERLKRYIFGSAEEMHSQQKQTSSNTTDNSGEPDRDRSNDGYSINRDITAPGATLALGLMYIKSHNASVASLLELPDTHYLLDFVRPDLLALRVIARSLILWNDVKPNREWIDEQIPDIVKKSIDFMKRKALIASNLNPDDHHDSSNEDVSDFDPQAVRQANAFIIAGSCFSMALRFAGSANRAAAAAIFERALYFFELRDSKELVNQVQRPDTPSLVACLCTAAISLAIVMAGTGDIDSFRLLRALRRRCEDTTLYGTHQAFGAAIGLLFLGGGKCTLGSSPQDVAILIASFFPHFPILSMDNQYHLQALRHLYVLASYDRILESVDIETGEKVCVPIELTLAATKDTIEVTTPYLLSNNAEFSEMRTKSERYYPIVIDASKWKDSPPTLFVKRKPGHLSYLQDPNSLQSLSIQTEGESFLKSISLFSNDAALSSFAKYFCASHRGNDDEVFWQFCNVIAHECTKDETSEMLPHYLNLFRLVESPRLNMKNVWDVRLLQSYLERKKRSVDTFSVDLMNPQFIHLIHQKLDNVFMTFPEHLVNPGQKWWLGDGSDSDIRPWLVWFDIPKLTHKPIQ